MRDFPSESWSQYGFKKVNNINSEGNTVKFVLLKQLLFNKLLVNRGNGFTPHMIMFGRKSTLYLLDPSDDISMLLIFFTIF